MTNEYYDERNNTSNLYEIAVRNINKLFNIQVYKYNTKVGVKGEC